MFNKDALLEEAEQHSFEAHGDEGPHADCKGCRALARRMLDEHGVTVEQYIATYGHLRGRDRYTDIALAMYEYPEDQQGSVWDE